MSLQQEEARVEAQSASLKKELGVRDLALTQILFIIGLTWIGVAGKLGSAKQPMAMPQIAGLRSPSQKTLVPQFGQK